MNLIQALRPPEVLRLALVGAGGKTSALFSLARDLVEGKGLDLPFWKSSPAVLVTTTTHLGSSQARWADRHVMVNRPAYLADLEGGQLSGVVLVTGPGLEGDIERLSGLDEEILGRLLSLADSRGLPLLIEADGSRRRPLKAPAEHEPVIPTFVNTVMVVAGLSALGRPLNEEWVYRPELFAALSGLLLGEIITPESVAQVLLSRFGGLKNIPPAARRVALLNQADTGELKAQADRIASRLVPTYHSVILSEQGSDSGKEKMLLPYKVYEPVAGIVLAGGGSIRYGQPKQLLSWRGEPFVRRVARAALEAGLAPVVVITGAHAELVEKAISDLDVIISFNEAWQQGQSSSIQAGLRALPPESGAAVFLLADQPQVPVGLIQALVQAHARTCSTLVAPRVRGRRANPVLIDRTAFPVLMSLSGDAGGRVLFSDPTHYPVEWVNWDDPAILLDVDTPEDYLRLVEQDRVE